MSDRTSERMRTLEVRWSSIGPADYCRLTRAGRRVGACGRWLPPVRSQAFYRCLGLRYDDGKRGQRPERTQPVLALLGFAAEIEADTWFQAHRSDCPSDVAEPLGHAAGDLRPDDPAKDCQGELEGVGHRRVGTPSDGPGRIVRAPHVDLRRRDRRRGSQRPAAPDHSARRGG
jgi:hypothetical protein